MVTADLTPTVKTTIRFFPRGMSRDMATFRHLVIIIIIIIIIIILAFKLNGLAIELARFCNLQTSHFNSK